MRARRLVSGALALALLVSSTAGAQELERNLYREQRDRPNVAMATFGWDPALSIAVGYGRVLPVEGARRRRDVLVFGGLGSPIFLFPGADGLDFQMGGRVFAFRGAWNLQTGLVLDAQLFDNGVSHGSAFKATFALEPGYYAPRWFVKLGLELRWTYLAHLTQSAAYLRAYPDAADGWYANTASYFYATVGGGCRIAEAFELDLRAGLRLASDFQSYTPYILPYVITISGSYAF